MPFYVASADAGGNRIAISEEQLLVGPANVDYPAALPGSARDTTGGTVVLQLPSKDPRRRAWEWRDLPNYLSKPRYIQLVHRLESLTAVLRRARGLPPWVWFRDTETDEFRVQRLSQGTATGATSTTLADSAKTWGTDALRHGTIEVVSGIGAGQRRTVVANSMSQVSVDPPWSVTPAGAAYSVQWSDPAWIRVRVLNVSKRPVSRTGVSYETVRVEFVVDDPAWNALGYTTVDPSLGVWGVGVWAANVWADNSWLGIT